MIVRIWKARQTMQQLFSILSLYNYDDTLFDYVEFPDELDHDKTVQSILLQCAELELVYPDLETMRTALVLWASSCRASWEKMAYTVYAEYNPLWNKDANITEDRDSGQQRSTSANGTVTGKVTGFNSSGFTNADQTLNDSEAQEDTTLNEKIVRRETGNIGVTSTQELIQREREIAEFNLTDYIVQDFKKRFCILVY